VGTGPALGDETAKIDGIANFEAGNAGLHTALNKTHMPGVQIRNGSFVQNQFFCEFSGFHDNPPCVFCTFECRLYCNKNLAISPVFFLDPGQKKQQT
jgi:hypothetical protein